MIKEWVNGLYLARAILEINPEGEFDKKGRWFPSEREDCGGSGSSVRSPSKNFPYSYMFRCRTRQHCQNLVKAALRGEDVPPDVWRYCPANEQFKPDTPTEIIRAFVLDGT